MSETSPEGWKFVPLSNLARVVSGGTPSRDVNSYWGGDIPWVTPTDITRTNGRYLLGTQENITRLGLSSSSATLLPPSAILMTSRATVGESRIAGTEVCTNQGFKSLVPQKGVNSLFLYYQMQRLRGAYKVFGIGSTFLEVSKKDTERFSVLMPTNEGEQKAIVAVIDSVDVAIEKTEALIAKYQQIKAGLMHDLFTRGVTANGKLRPPREQAPELYQESPIGWIPKEWGLERCGNLCTRICVGIVIKPTQYYVVDGVPAFRSANVREDGIDPSNLVYISPTANTLLAKSQVKAGDILSVRTGYPGTSAVVPMEFHESNCIDILISSPGDRINSEFLCDWINSSFGKEQVLRQQGGMAQQHFNVGEMRELLVVIPSNEEQARIRERAISVNMRLQLEKDMLQKFQQQKLGLMHDLLTGHVRIKLAESEVVSV